MRRTNGGGGGGGGGGGEGCLICKTSQSLRFRNNAPLEINCIKTLKFEIFSK